MLIIRPAYMAIAAVVFSGFSQTSATRSRTGSNPTTISTKSDTANANTSTNPSVRKFRDPSSSLTPDTAVPTPDEIMNMITARKDTINPYCPLEIQEQFMKGTASLSSFAQDRTLVQSLAYPSATDRLKEFIYMTIQADGTMPMIQSNFIDAHPLVLIFIHNGFANLPTIEDKRLYDQAIDGVLANGGEGIKMFDFVAMVIAAQYIPSNSDAVLAVRAFAQRIVDVNTEFPNKTLSAISKSAFDIISRMNNLDLNDQEIVEMKLRVLGSYAIAYFASSMPGETSADIEIVKGMLALIAGAKTEDLVQTSKAVIKVARSTWNWDKMDSEDYMKQYFTSFVDI